MCLSVFGWGVCVRGMGMMSPRSGREMTARGVMMEDGGRWWSGERQGCEGRGDYLMEIFLTVLPIFIM